MQFGLVLPTETVDTAATDAWRTVERQATLADQGFDSVWVGEHHFMDHVYFDNLQALSYLAGVTENVALGTSVCLAPLHNPVQLAERVANLDALSGGRTVLGIGLGYRQKEFDVLGVDKSRRVPRLLETLDVLDRCWREDGVDYDGEEFAFTDVDVNPKPVQDGGPPVWLGGGVPAAVRRAARHGDAWLPGPSTEFDDLDSLYEVYDRERETEPATRPLWREVFVAPEHDQAVERMKESFVRKYDFYASWGAESGDGPSKSVDERFAEYRADRALVGTPAEVADEIQACRERFGTDHLLVRTQWPGMDPAVAEESIELLRDEVIPEFS